MEDAADHVVHDIFPQVPVRQRVLSLPRRLPFQAARDPKIASRLLDLFTRAIFAWHRRQARRPGAADPRTAGVTAVQRFGSAIDNSMHRARVVPAGAGRAGGSGNPAAPHGPSEHAVPATVAATPGAEPRPEPPATFRLRAPGEARPDRTAPRTRTPWAELLRKVFALDVLECPRCAGRFAPLNVQDGAARSKSVA
jgi:hypothetical protein